MSSALALASVTSVLKHLLDDRLIASGIVGSVGDVTVSAIAPDRVPVGAEERSQLNLFLYRVTPHSRWRQGGASGQRAQLSLDLHYLLSAYGEQDLQAEILLGHAIQLLHETPVLTRAVIEGALGSLSRNGSNGASKGRAPSEPSPLGGVEEMTVTPAYLTLEETSKLWSTLQARYRPSVAFEISGVQIDAFEAGA